MITISILGLRPVFAPDNITIESQHVELVVSNGSETYYMSRSDVPAGATYQQVMTWLDNRAQEVWEYAAANGRQINLFQQVGERILLEVLASWVTKKLNALHQVAGLPLLTEATVKSELKQEIIDKIAE
jgi:adenosyl cobinamide kinase/adenosyl cobinamide phosphate guanylyltransferase